jgi:putative SOS response-associated peptidase YedK
MLRSRAGALTKGWPDVQSLFDDEEPGRDPQPVQGRPRQHRQPAVHAGHFPDYPAPIVRNADGFRELAMARWGMPSSSKALIDATAKRAAKLEAKGKQVDFKELLRMEPDSGTTNIRNTSSKHWKRWLGVESRCIVLMSSFSEFNRDAGGDIWFALDDSRPLVCFAGMWTNWTCVRKVREGETVNDLFAPDHGAER